MSTTPTPVKAVPTTAARKIGRRWGAELTAAGWTAIPNVIFQRQKALKESMVVLWVVRALRLSARRTRRVPEWSLNGDWLPSSEPALTHQARDP